MDIDMQTGDISFFGNIVIFIERVLDFLTILLHALPLSLFLTVFAAIFGLLIGTICGISLNSKNFILSKTSSIYTLLFRGTPLLVQFYLIYYGTGQILPSLNLYDTFLWPILREGLWYALLALSLNQGAYNAVVIHGALKAIPRGQVEAAMTIGMSQWQILRHITLPLAFRQSLPILANDIIILLKSTALASTTTVMEVMGITRELQRSYNMSFEPLIAAGIIYFVVVIILAKSIAQIERRIMRYRIK